MKSLKNIILGISCASAIALTGCIDETLRLIKLRMSN